MTYAEPATPPAIVLPASESSRDRLREVRRRAEQVMAEIDHRTTTASRLPTLKQQ